MSDYTIMRSLDVFKDQVLVFMEKDGNDFDREISVVIKQVSPGNIRMISLFVPFEHRLKGLARRLVDAVLLSAKAQKWTVWIECDAYEDAPMDSGQLRAWYKKLGFEDIEGHPFAMKWSVK